MTTPDRPPNRLAKETSPYLLQHAHNPVDWYPWGEEAFEKARRLDRPIFLSVGYSSCHWCHVMEHESFEDGDVAAILNDHFVSVKVDREERPDVDAIYMTAVQLTTGSGGWPMSVFLTPELRPFFGGTYFPRESMYGRPGFKDVLRHLAAMYRDQRRMVNQVSDDLTARLGSVTVVQEGSELPGVEVLETAFRHAVEVFDSTSGGFGTAPKFPHAMDLSMLLRYWKRTGEKLALDIPLLTLRKMAGGGIHDQIGGGFHRYSVDREWLVPHFEKMLYDNALLAPVYFEAYQVTRDPFFLRIGRNILDYVIREMTAPGGGFYSATDADSEGEEGKYFVWSPAEVEAVLGSDRARAINHYYNITEGGDFEGKSIPHVTQSPEEVARDLELEVEDLERLLGECRELLYRERERRIKPFRDEKVISSWNGLMLTAMARGFTVTGDTRYLEAALSAARFLEERTIVDGLLHRIFKDGAARIPGYLDDYAYTAKAFLDLHEATFDPLHLERSRWLMDLLLEEFSDPGGKGFFYSASRHKNLIHRRKDLFDNATPSANWVAAVTLLRLAALTGESRYRQHAESLYGGLREVVHRVPMGFATALAGIEFLIGPVLEVAVLGDPGAESTRDALRAINRRFLPAKVVSGAAARVDAAIAGRIPLLADRDAIDGGTTVYLCENFACRAPITDLPSLERALDERVRPAPS